MKDLAPDYDTEGPGDPARRAYARTMTNVSVSSSAPAYHSSGSTAGTTESEESGEEVEVALSGAAVGRRSEIWEAVSGEEWHSQHLSVVVVGASGDLAKKKTYPSLFALFSSGLLPASTVIYGYARSKKTGEEFREHLKPYLLKGAVAAVQGGGAAGVRLKAIAAKQVDAFLSLCHYHSGKSYGDVPSYRTLVEKLRESEEEEGVCNRLFYLAIPPDVFGDTAAAVRSTAMEHEEDESAGSSSGSGGGWVRLVVEKPFGRDLPSCLSLSSSLAAHFAERHLYRIDHYLGKEMVQNLLTFRFGNPWIGHLWHRGAISGVTVEFKEPFGTEGRGGYFDKYGIIRDILQNHLLQVLTLLAMEAPEEEDAEGEDVDYSAAERIRDAKVDVLSSIPPVELSDCVLGQYDGYADDPTIENKDTNCPTYAAMRLSVNTPRWEGVPFLLVAGKALDERKCEVRVRFRPSPGSRSFAAGRKRQNQHSELVLRLQPGECIMLKSAVKTPGYSSETAASSLSLNYSSSFSSSRDPNPDAYTRLLLDVLRGNRAPFVRDDELRRSWEIFTPLLHRIEGERVRPHVYKMGTEGPEEGTKFVERALEESGGAVNGNVSAL